MNQRLPLRLCAFALLISFAVGAPFRAITLQDIGGTLAFQGQDIVGGAAVIFKPPARVKDLVGGAAMVMATRRPQRASRSSDVARNRPRPPVPATTTAATSTTATATPTTETLKAQGNTY
ncbi:MAG TPA: hypothetical protein VFU83_04715, partial [Pyrinomonadaceae bacterium]|nr:hypothetical protein [Pyrinomonadaceae bacterium]